ncbi:mucin-7-like [Camelus dromedarius]|uniref:mucin-7-like n=1 Tax=Camelus dromedarius TaxID=9838 RepID=UPI00311A02BF
MHLCRSTDLLGSEPVSSILGSEPDLPITFKKGADKQQSLGVYPVRTAQPRRERLHLIDLLASSPRAAGRTVPQRPSISRIKGTLRSPCPAPFPPRRSLTARPAPPTSDRASERGNAPPVRAACRPAAPQGRLLAVRAGPGATPGKAASAAPPGRQEVPAAPSQAGQSSRTATNTALIRSHPPPPRPPPSSPPDLTRGHRPQEPALRPSPVNGGAERKEPSLYARSEPGETVTNKEGSSDRLANQLGVARPDGPTS